ncbi:uncharacterized protein LOC107030225 [Solanum pennellii]|uniref:Uncharacterized protein LOC107030225 n=1 Tax=Solanum pennellii TaxID=28526 RepID=A0ABM1HL37_SOLPN|nr:uncharacterized protein LOC107030225 [Solanum pennellii]
MPLRRAVRDRLARRNVKEQGLPNALEVQPQGEVTNAELREAIRMLSQAMTNQVGKQRRYQQEKVDTLRIREFLSMNPPSFTSSSTTEDLETWFDQWKKDTTQEQRMRVGYVLRRLSWGISFRRELKEDKVQKFITFKQEFDEYGLKFT